MNLSPKIKIISSSIGSSYTGSIKKVFALEQPATSINVLSRIEFGEMTDARNYNDMAGSHTRAVICGGYDSSAINIMDYAHIMSTGNFVDFGDLQQARGRQAALSNGHGGL